MLPIFEGSPFILINPGGVFTQPLRSAPLGSAPRATTAPGQILRIPATALAEVERGGFFGRVFGGRPDVASVAASRDKLFLTWFIWVSHGAICKHHYRWWL